MLTYADRYKTRLREFYNAGGTCMTPRWRMLTYPDRYKTKLRQCYSAGGDLYGASLTYADVCWRMLTGTKQSFDNATALGGLHSVLPVLNSLLSALSKMTKVAIGLGVTLGLLHLLQSAWNLLKMTDIVIACGLGDSNVERRFLWYLRRTKAGHCTN